jgi:hypothetical protein
MSNRALLAAILLAAAPLHAGVNYYLTDNLHAIDPLKWTTVGSLAANTAGLAAASPNGGALISKVPVPDGTAEAEVLATLTLLHSGGVYTEYLQATQNSHTGPNGGGAYLAFEMQSPTFDSAGHCTANFLVLQSTASGSVSLLSSFQHACRNGMTMRFAVHGKPSGMVALVWPDQAQPVEFAISGAIGSPGIGSYNAPAGNAISLVQLGAIARETPEAVAQQTIGISTFRNRIDVQWKPVALSAASAGMSCYWIYRDGDYFMRTDRTNFSDEAVSPGATHSYTIYAVDQHFNFSAGTSVTASTPAITTVTKK